MPTPSPRSAASAFPYEVRRNDTLSAIAGRYLGDIYSFYILARYNDIKVPKLVAGGQTIRIPGKPRPEARPEPKAEARPGRRPRPEGGRQTSDARTGTCRPAPAPPPVPAAAPVPVAPPEPTPAEKALRSAEAAERDGNIELAHKEYERAAGMGQAGAAVKAEQMRKQLVNRHTLQARGAFARHDLVNAIKAWDRVLDLEPGNNTARLERQKCTDLRKIADSL